MEPQIRTKKLEKFSEKLRAGKISCHYTWLLHAKNCPSRGRFLGSFLTARKPSKGSISAAKRTEKEKKDKRKKFQKSKSLKTQVTFSSQNFDFYACPSHNALKRDAGGKKSKRLCCKRIFDWTKGNLAEIQSKNDKMSKKSTFGKKFQESMG